MSTKYYYTIYAKLVILRLREICNRISPDLLQYYKTELCHFIAGIFGMYNAIRFLLFFDLSMNYFRIDLKKSGHYKIGDCACDDITGFL